MGTGEVGVLSDIVKNTTNDTVYIFIILAVVFLGLTIPLYTLILKDRKNKNQAEAERLAQYMAREKQIIDVVSSNTEALTKLSTTLERDSKDTVNSIMRVHDRIDAQNALILAQSEALARISTAMEESIRNQSTIKDDIKNTLLAVNRKTERKTKPYEENI